MLNLTIPAAHHEVSMKAVKAGKHAHSEKPFTVTRDEGLELLAAAKAAGVRCGAAPDTFLGGGHQTARKLIDDGWIGEPVACTAFMQCHGHESWHPSPEFYYKEGGGPMFDMGPYYLTDLVQLLGPVARVSGSTKKSFETRTITSERLYGTEIKVDVPTHIAGIMEFENGAVGTIITSFDVWKHHLPCIEIHGTEGSIFVPCSHPYAGGGRGLGVADLAQAVIDDRPHRCNGELAYHVLDLMHAFHDASDEKRFVDIESSCERPAAMLMDPEF